MRQSSPTHHHVLMCAKKVTSTTTSTPTPTSTTTSTTTHSTHTNISHHNNNNTPFYNTRYTLLLPRPFNGPICLACGNRNVKFTKPPLRFQNGENTVHVHPCLVMAQTTRLICSCASSSRREHGHLSSRSPCKREAVSALAELLVISCTLAG